MRLLRLFGWNGTCYRVRDRSNFPFTSYYGGGHRGIDGYVVVDVTISADQNEKSRCGWKPVGLQLRRLTVLRVSRCH